MIPEADRGDFRAPSLSQDDQIHETFLRSQPGQNFAFDEIREFRN